MKLILRSENSLGAMEEYDMFCIIFGGVVVSSHSPTRTQPRRRRRRQPQSSPIAAAAAQQQQCNPKLLKKYPRRIYDLRFFTGWRVYYLPRTTNGQGLPFYPLKMKQQPHLCYVISSLLHNFTNGIALI
jgi:hypothetical protein